MKHNPDADDVMGCDACLEICTDPKNKNEWAAFAKADREHFAEIMGRNS